MSKKIFLLFLVMALSISTSVVFANEEYRSIEYENPIISFEVLNTDGTPLEQTGITVIHVKTDRVVYQGQSDKQGHASFQVAIDDYISSTGEQNNNIYEVFEVYYASPIDNELQREVFSVPFISKGVDRSKDESLSITNSLPTSLKLKFKGEENKKPTILPTIDSKESQLSTSSAEQTPSPAANGTCIPGPGFGWELCTETNTNYSSETKIGTINVGSNETGSVKLTGSSTIKLSAGYKQNSGSWSVQGEVTSQTTSGTSTTYTIPGKVIYDNGSHYNASVNYFAYYNMNYKKKTMYYNGVRQWDDHTVTPVEFNGGSQRLDYFASSNNGLASGKTDPTVFTVGTVSSTEKSYSSEISLGGGFSVPTPAGTFSGNVNTTYKSATTYTWKSNTGTTYYHYRINGIYYVTS